MGLLDVVPTVVAAGVTFKLLDVAMKPERPIPPVPPIPAKPYVEKREMGLMSRMMSEEGRKFSLLDKVK